MIFPNIEIHNTGLAENLGQIPISAASTVLGQIKAYIASVFTAKPIKAWNGTSWVVKPLKHYNGTSWVTTPY